MAKPAGLAVSVAVGKKKPTPDLGAPDDFGPKPSAPAMDDSAPDTGDGGDTPKISMDAANAIISYIMSMTEEEGAEAQPDQPVDNSTGAPSGAPMGGGRMPYGG